MIGWLKVLYVITELYLHSKDMEVFQPHSVYREMKLWCMEYLTILSLLMETSFQLIAVPFIKVFMACPWLMEGLIKTGPCSNRTIAERPSQP